jgi:hypothetical protein
MREIIGFEVDRDEVLGEWSLKLRYTISEIPDIPQVEYRRHKDLMTLFSFVITFSGRDDDANDTG